METELRVVFFGNAYFVSDAIYAALQESDCRIVAGVLPPVSARKRASSVRRLHDLWNRVRPVERAKLWRNYARMGGFGQMPPEVLGKIHTVGVPPPWTSWIEHATSSGLPILRPADVRTPSEETLAQLAVLSPDLFVSAGYTRIIAPSLLRLARLGAYNFHPSPLPRYKGGYPVFFALRDGAKSLTMTCHEMVAETDEGDIAYQATIPVDQACRGMTEAYIALMQASVSMPSRLITGVRAGKVPRIRQTGEGSFCVSPRPEHFELDWTLHAWLVNRHVCLYEGRAWTKARGIPLGIAAGLASGSCRDTPPGTVIAIDDNGISIACGGETAFVAQEMVVRAPYPTRRGTLLVKAHYAAPRLGIGIGFKLGE